ncbi:CopD family protein [uncultured Exiguobacterium sp.]|uniref:copper resistance D family protein n=2 Tax=uncultured Exiguobacterium sp. TaxID=202669 RepID=UPI0025D1BF66|nr:CopD family protein [uncultured Exiguobacterium sp.]
MIILYVISDTLLYGCLALLIGYFSIPLIPVSYRPDISFPVRRIRLFILLMPLFFSLSVIRIVYYLYEDIGLWMTLRSVLFTFEVGHAWIFMTVLCLLLFTVTFSTRQGRFSLGVFLLFLMVVTLAWAGHASSITGAQGIVVHTIHSLSVFVWTGGLLVLGISSKTAHNWKQFLEWFKPLIILCVVLIVGSGIYLMSVVIPIGDYAESWILPYGQSLLWKHVLILPILILGFSNGKWSYAHPDQPFHIRRSRMRMEGILLLLLFAATAWLGQQEPPHSIQDTLKTSGSGTLSAFLFTSLDQVYSRVQFEPTITAFTLFMTSLLFSGLLVFAIKKTNDALNTLYLSLGIALSLYFGLLYSLSVFV